MQTGQLTLVTFDLYPNLDYVAPYWRNLSEQELFDGEAVSVYIDGPDENGGRAGDFYELETLSPALVLLPGESFLHRNCIYHLRGDWGHIGAMCRLFLNAGVDEIEGFLAAAE